MQLKHFGVIIYKEVFLIIWLELPHLLSPLVECHDQKDTIRLYHHQ